jgi:hypothetical protein
VSPSHLGGINSHVENAAIKDGDIDFEMVNPAYTAVVLSGVVPPPSLTA